MQEDGNPFGEKNKQMLQVTPNQCRLRDLTYASPIKVDVEYKKMTAEVPHAEGCNCGVYAHVCTLLAD